MLILGPRNPYTAQCRLTLYSSNRVRVGRAGMQAKGSGSAYASWIIAGMASSVPSKLQGNELDDSHRR